VEKHLGLIVIIVFYRCTIHLEKNKEEFKKGKVDMSKALELLTADQLWLHVSQLPKVTDNSSFEVEGFEEQHNWTKKSIFWDLPYWKTNLLRHNLDVMHIEKFFFDNVFNTVMDVKGKTKDNVKARLDLAEHYRRPELEL